MWLGAVPQFLGIPEDFQELNGQFLGFEEMVKLTRMGETHQLKLVLCREIALRHMEYMVVMKKKIPSFGSQTRERSSERRAS